MCLLLLSLYENHTRVSIFETTSWSSYQEEKVGAPLTGLTSSHLCACHKTRLGFLTSYVVVFFVFSELRWEVIVRFVDISEIVDHHCINFILRILVNLNDFFSAINNKLRKFRVNLKLSYKNKIVKCTLI